MLYIHNITMTQIKKGRFFVGSVGVDSGQIFITDPCSIKNHEALKNEANWDDFCNTRFPDAPNKDTPRVEKPVMEMYDGICTSTNFGDGEYPVYTTFDKDGRPTKIEVIFTRNTTEADEAKEVEYQ